MGDMFMQRAIFLILASMLVGCASAPTSPPETHRVKVDASNIVAVQYAGYKLVTKNGEPLYCRTDTVTGSRLETRTVCLTERELQDQMNANKQAMTPITSKQVGPSGH
jgi:hypothetical protein